MLRITTDDKPPAPTMRLEGRLEGEWVTLAARCWRDAVARLEGRGPRVDVTDVTFISPEGKALLAEMHAQGAEFRAEGILGRAVVAEIVAEPTGKGAVR